MSRFVMKDLGDTEHMFGMHIAHDRRKRCTELCQSEYIAKVIHRFDLSGPKTILSANSLAYLRLSKNKPLQLIIGSLMYAMVTTMLTSHLSWEL
mgnify:CR=1 FL=1